MGAMRRSARGRMRGRTTRRGLEAAAEAEREGEGVERRRRRGIGEELGG